MKRHIYFVFYCMLLSPAGLLAQVAPSPSNIVFTDYDEQMAGDVDQDYIQFVLDKAHSAGWKVTASVTGNFVNQSDPSAFVTPQHILLQFNSVSNNSYIPANTGQIPLGTAEVPLISGVPALNPPPNLTYHYDFIVQGGDHLLVTNGVYETTLVLRVYDANNQFVSAFNFQVSFKIKVTGKGGPLSARYSLTLQHKADVINFQFQNVGDYSNGISVIKPNGLKIRIKGKLLLPAFEVLVHTTTNFLTSQSTSATIPVSTFRLKASGGPSSITQNTIPLSSAAQTLIKYQSLLSLPTKKYIFDLKYFVNLNEISNLLKPPATYSTQVYFTLVPL